MKWIIIYKCAGVCNFYFAYLRHKTIFYVGTLLILTAARVCALVCAFGCRFVSANGLLVDVCQCCLLMFVCLPLSRHFPCCKTW